MNFLNYWFEGERELDEEVLNIVNNFQEKGVKCYLASDNEKYRAEYILNKVRLKNHFDDTFFSCFIGYTKSEPEFFKTIIEYLNLKPSEIVYFDDDPENVKVAKVTGIDARLYRSASQLEKLL